MRFLSNPLRLLSRPSLQPALWARSVNAASAVDSGNVKPFEEIPGPSGVHNIPVLGSMLFFKPFTNYTMENLQNIYNDLLDKYGSLVRIRFGKPAVLVADPEDIEVVLKHEGKYPFRSAPLITEMFNTKPGALKGLVSMQHEEWQSFRSPLNPRLLRAKSAQYYLPAQNEVAELLVKRIKSEDIEHTDFLDLFFRYACESISIVAFNKRLGYLDPDVEKYPEKAQALTDIQCLFKTMMASFSVPPFALKHFPLKIKKDYSHAAQRLTKLVTGYYDDAAREIERRQKEGTFNPEENNFMYSLMTTEKLSTEQMTVVALDLFAAGTDSTARNLQIVLYNLARYPDKQEKLYEEIRHVIGSRGPLTMEALTKMPYLLACLKESFRIIFPAIAGSTRCLPTDIVLQGYRIPAGTEVMMMNQWAVKNPKHFPDPTTFSPERWLRDETGNRPHPVPAYALLPFGFGPRQCLGKRFAEQEIYLAVVKILQNFRVSLDENQDKVEIIYKIFAATKKPIKFKFESRD